MIFNFKLMKKLSAFTILFLLSISFSFAQKSNTEKFYSKNWKITKSDNNSPWSSLESNKKTLPVANTSKSRVIKSSNRHSTSSKINKSTYPNSINNTVTNRSPKKSGILKKEKVTSLKYNKQSSKKKTLFSKRKKNK